MASNKMTMAMCVCVSG